MSEPVTRGWDISATSEKYGVLFMYLIWRDGQVSWMYERCANPGVCLSTTKVRNEEDFIKMAGREEFEDGQRQLLAKLEKHRIETEPDYKPETRETCNAN
jgi:hypothetical protein